MPNTDVKLASVGIERIPSALGICVNVAMYEALQAREPFAPYMP